MKTKEGKHLGGKARLYEILNILSKHHITKGLTPLNFRLMIEDLGPTFIKFGQIMSMRTDILPEEYCIELTKLRKSVSPLPYSIIKETIERETGIPLEDTFSFFEKEPLGSASIAQVHIAKLKDGTKVIVKVQRPGIYDKMATDIALLKKAISIIKIPFINNVIDLNGVLDEIWFAAKQELNFLEEADHQREFAENNKDFVYIASPKIYEKYTTSAILVMEYIDGISLDEIDLLQKKGYDLEEIASKLSFHYMKQVIDDGYFHADPHPDNLKIQDGKIVFLDFGMMGRLGVRNRKLLQDCIEAMMKNDIHTIEKGLLLLGKHNNRVDHSKLYSDLELMVDRYSHLELDSMNLEEIFTDILKITNEHRIQMPKDITMLMRGVIILEGVLHTLSPTTSLMRVLATRISGHKWKHLLDKENFTNLGQKAYGFQNGMLELPNEMLTFMKMAVRGETKFNLELTDSDNKIGKLEKMLHQILICVLDASFLLGGSLLCTAKTSSTLFGLPTLGFLFLTISFFLTIWLLIKMYIDHRR